MKKKTMPRLTLNRETVRLAGVAAGLATHVAGCQTGATQCGPSSPPETCPPA